MTWFHRLDDFLIDRVAEPAAERSGPRLGLGPHGQAWALRRIEQPAKVLFWAWAVWRLGAADSGVAARAWLVAGAGAVLLFWLCDPWLPWARRLRRDALAEAADADVWRRGARGSRVDGFSWRCVAACWTVLFGLSAPLLLFAGRPGPAAAYALFAAGEAVDLASRCLHACRSRPPGHKAARAARARMAHAPG
jgi:hypothetical protein